MLVFKKKYVRGGAMEMVEMVVRAVQYAQTKVPTRVMVGKRREGNMASKLAAQKKFQYKIKHGRDPPPVRAEL